MNKNKKIAILIVVLLGIIIPFFPYLTVIEMFFLIIPFAIFFAVTLIYLIISLLNKNLNTQKALFVFSILPIFVLSQLLSSFTVDKIQRIRSNRIITEIEKLKSETGNLPENYALNAGIEYIKINGEENFVIKYSRGFMVTEKYESKYKHWRSYGWND
jgi:hypothetical protein